MPLSRNRLYSILFVTCLAGYIWIYYHNLISSSNLEVCLVKRITSIPCPSCGSTRSVLALLNGQFLDALYFNPLGFLMVLVLGVSPLWILYDVILKKETLYKVYLDTETQFKNKRFAFSFALIMVCIWVWNIMKNL